MSLSSTTFRSAEKHWHSLKPQRIVQQLETDLQQGFSPSAASYRQKT